MASSLLQYGLKMATNRRLKGNTGSNNDVNSYNNHSDDPKYKQKTSIYHPQMLWFAIFLFYGFIYLFIHHRNAAYPEPKTLASELPGQFIEERARKYLVDITSIGADRFVGSVRNEKIAVEYLVKEIKKIQQDAISANAKAHEIELDLQKTTGSFSLPFLSPFTSYYHNVQNVVVKLSPSGGSPDSLLVNCHYDSVLDSPGKSVV